MNESNAVALSHGPVLRRDRHFAIGAQNLRNWHPEGLHVSQFFNALSLFFPDGEQFFIDSVRHYRDRIGDRQLLEDIRGFIGQEAMHGREHRAYNQALADAGFDVARIEARVIRLLTFARSHLHPAHQLAATIALEHFTAILADVVLRDPRVLDGAAPEMARLWRWHALEETEHKAVAYDVYREVMARRPLRGYLLRCSVMIGVSLRFTWQTARAHYELVRHDAEHRNWRGWLALVRNLWFTPGVYRQIVLPWLAYFRPGFHPWQHDNRALLARWQPDYDEPVETAHAA